MGFKWGSSAPENKQNDGSTHNNNIQAVSSFFQGIKLNPAKPVVKNVKVWKDKNGKKRKKTETRGAERTDLLSRRLRDYGQALLLLGVKHGVISQTENAPGEDASTLKPWQERVAHVVFGGELENYRGVIQQFQQNEANPPQACVAKNGSYAYRPKGSVCLVEHLAKHPLAYGIKGMRATCIRFNRGKVAASTTTTTTTTPQTTTNDPFYVFTLEKNEPSPVVYTIDDGESIDCLYYPTLGLYPLSKVEDSEYNDYIVENNVITQVDGLYLASELEPSIQAPNPEQCRLIHNQMSSKRDMSNIGKLCLYRSSKQYIERASRVVSTSVIEPDVTLVLEAYGLINRMMRYAEEMDVAMTGKVVVNVELLKALRKVFRLLEVSPWYRTFCYKWLFQWPSSGQNPFELGSARMRMMGAGDPSSCGYLPSYLPKRLHGKPPENAMIVEDEEEKEETQILHRVSKRLHPCNPPKSEKRIMREEASKRRKIDEAEQLRLEKLEIIRMLDNGENDEAVVSQEAMDDVTQFKNTSAKKKKDKAVRKGRRKIVKTKCDGRIYEEKQFDIWLTRLHVPLTLFSKSLVQNKTARWDKLWFLQKIASSSEGRYILDGDIWHLRREDHIAQKSSQQKGKTESIESRTTVERMEFFKQFRGQAKMIWKRFRELTKRSTASRPSNSEFVSNADEEDDELDEFSSILAASIMRKDDNDTVVWDRSKDFSVYAAKLHQENNNRRDQEAWHVVREKERSSVPPFKVRRQIQLTYIDRGRVSSDHFKVTATYGVGKHNRIRV